MNLNQLHYFVTLAHIEHYTRAAEMLSITQPSLSHAISMLEQELETNLFEKRGRNVVLTKYGKVFLEYVEEALKILDSGVKKTRALTSDTGGVIDLAYIFTLGSVFVPQLVGGFLKEHEDWDVNFRFSVGNTTEIIQGLKEEKYDIAFCSRKEKESGIDFVPIAKEKLVVVVPRDHELAGRGSVDLKETLPYPQVYFTKNSGLRPVIDQLFEQTGGTPKIAYEILEDASMAGLVAENFGIAVMPEIPILKNLNVDVLDIVLKEKEKFRNTMNMVWVILNTWNAFSQFRSGVVTPHLWSALAVGAPMAAVGFFVGMAFLKKINKETFLRIVYCVLLFVGANMLITSLLAL